MDIRDYSDFGAIIPSFLDDYPLDPFEFRLFARIQRRAGKKDCFESLPNMAKGCHMSLSKARIAFRVLTNCGLITVQDRSKEGKTYLCALNPVNHWASPASVESIRKQLTPTKSDRGIKSDSATEFDKGGVSDLVGEGVSDLVGEGINIKESPLMGNSGEKEDFDDFDSLDNPSTNPPEGSTYTPDCVSNHTGWARDNNTIDTQSSAYRNEQLFNKRKPYPVYRTSSSPNGIKPEFLEWLQSVHLPTIAYYKENGVSLAKAKSWVLNKEREQCQEILEDFYQEMLDSKKPKFAPPPTPDEEVTPEEETWRLIVKAVHDTNEFGLELNIRIEHGVWGLQTTFNSSGKSWNGKIKDLAKKFPLHTLPREFHQLGYDESCYRKLIAKHPHLHFPAPLPD